MERTRAALSTNLLFARAPSTASRSPSLPEGGLDNGVDIFANTPEFCVNLSICEPDHFQIVPFQNFCSKFVLLLAFLGIML